MILIYGVNQLGLVSRTSNIPRHNKFSCSEQRRAYWLLQALQADMLKAIPLVFAAQAWVPPADFKGAHIPVRITSRRIKITGSARSPRPQNVPGDFYVDHTCIDCDTCRWMAQSTFSRVDGMSAVLQQPSSEQERLAALQALVSCPTSSIHTVRKPTDILEIQSTFPLPIDEHSLPGVYHCGYHSKKSFGAASYLIVRAGGNIFVDSPRYAANLAHEIERLGGVRYMFLSHRDDVADHERWKKRFQCDRILHADEIQKDTVDVEMKLDGCGPWGLGSDIDLIYTPGHTEGSVCLFYKPMKALFTGDHISASPEGGMSSLLEYNWYSVKVQVESVRSLLALDFLWILPGDGYSLKA